MNFGAGARVAGGVLGGDNHGIGGGTFHGAVHLEATTHVHYRFGGRSASHSSGAIPPAALDQLAECFADPGPAFAELVQLLGEEHVLVIGGPPSSGRRTAALMLLHRLGATPVRAVARDTPLDALVPDADEEGSSETRGHVLCDLATGTGPLTEANLLAVRDRLAQRNQFLVITVDPRTALEDVVPHRWRPPPPADILRAHLRTLVSTDTAAGLLSLPAVEAFLARDHQPRETASFASVLARYSTQDVDERQVEDYSLQALKEQIREWFEEDDLNLHLREKAFLIALAAFDEGPYALTAEVSDGLYIHLQQTVNTKVQAAVPVFGTHIGKRLQRARARQYEAEEPTEWGPVRQVKARYQDDRTALIILQEVWTSHPSARPALVRWLRDLAKDGRPLVRTRAASVAAVLAHSDLPSAMALVIEPWAASKEFRPRSVAVNTLALAHNVGTPNVPRILDAWCDGRTPHLRWVAIRTHGLIGPERPTETMAALRAAARHGDLDETEVTQDESGAKDGARLAEALAEAVELLLLSTAGEAVLAESLRALEQDRPAFFLAVSGFLGACRHTPEDDPLGRPLVLDWYARTDASESRAARHIATLWRAALSDRVHRDRALRLLRQWVLSADRDPWTEHALAGLLPALAVDASERRRVEHLLRTMPGEDGVPPSVASRLLAAVPSASPPTNHR
ncbi:hypothetical protein ABZY45_07940 [Streptomyces sp. NPDC006516]|uniref:hypothetical protein n=1 Tax=Streptomyces sp. NPDC006516 TaxID=3154309 RepID=UPI0033A9F9DB